VGWVSQEGAGRTLGSGQNTSEFSFDAVAWDAKEHGPTEVGYRVVPEGLDVQPICVSARKVCACRRRGRGVLSRAAGGLDVRVERAPVV